MRTALIVLIVAILIALLLTAIPGRAWAQETGDIIPVWYGLAETMVSLLAFVLTIVSLWVLPTLREWLSTKSGLAKIMKDEALARKMDEGAINIIRAVEAGLKEKIPGETGFDSEDFAEPPMTALPGQMVNRNPSKAVIVNKAAPILKSEFRETLQHFGKGDEQVRNYILGRVDRALESRPGK